MIGLNERYDVLAGLRCDELDRFLDGEFGRISACRHLRRQCHCKGTGFKYPELSDKCPCLSKHPLDCDGINHWIDDIGGVDGCRTCYKNASGKEYHSACDNCQNTNYVPAKGNRLERVMKAPNPIHVDFNWETIGWVCRMVGYSPSHESGYWDVQSDPAETNLEAAISALEQVEE